MSEIEELRREVAVLREELGALRAMIGASNAGARGELPHLRCASLTVVGETTEEKPRFAATLFVDESGGALHLVDEGAGESRGRATLMLTDAGATLALCGEDGVPRLVAQSRLEGGVISLMDENHDMGAQLAGAVEASWLALLQGGQPTVTIVGLERGGSVEVFDDQNRLQGALPPTQETIFPPPATTPAPDGQPR